MHRKRHKNRQQPLFSGLKNIRIPARLVRMEQPTINRWQTLFLGGFLIALCTVFIYFRWQGDTSFQSLVLWVENAKSSHWFPWVFYLSFMLAIMALPITLFPIVGGVFFHFWVALPLNLLAATVGSCLPFVIARLVGRKNIEHFLKGRWQHINNMVGKEGFKTVFFLRWTGLPPFVVANYVLGLSKVRLKDYVLGTVAGILPWMVVVTYMSHSLWQSLIVGGEKGFSMALLNVMGPMSTFSGLVFVTYLAGRIVKKRKKKANRICSQIPQS